MSKTYKEISKENWSPSKLEIQQADIKLGCLLRIADANERSAAATEVMARNYNELLAEKEKFKSWYYEERAERERLERSIRTHKANYTRLKNKLEQQNG